MKKLSLIAALSLFVLLSCDRTPGALAPKEYGAWLADPDNGLYKSRKINGITLDARFLPAEYQAYRSYRPEQGVPFDSAVQSYKCGLAFQVTLQAEKSNVTYSDLMYYNVPDQQELSNRMRYLSFNIQEFITLTSDSTTYEPVLSNFEGYNALANKISFIVAFVLPEYHCGTFDSVLEPLQLTFQDPYWEMGTNHFSFEKKVIMNLPKLSR